MSTIEKSFQPPDAAPSDAEIACRRALFDATGNGFCGVEFVKKDGTLC